MHRRALPVLAAAIALLAACTPARYPAPPAGEAMQLQILGLPNARFWIDDDPAPIYEEMQRASAREVATAPPGFSLSHPPPIDFLALSGGGDNGAFGAGLLIGWTAHGDRPEFRLVTGVSTGALIAPFAFLGPAYDDQLRAVFTDITPDDVLRTRFITAAITNDALADTAPLFALISKFADQRMLDDIAAQYARGRLLLIGTTNIDLQRPVVWNMGAIAASHDPGALDLFRRILLASASIPGAFPPVMIDVDVNGEHRQEMHVDGGAVAQTFLYPPSIKLRARGGDRIRTAYIIRNGRLDPEWTDTDRAFLSIAGRAIETMIHYSGVNDVVRIYFTTQRDHVGYRLAYIDSGFAPRAPVPFDQAYMRALFDYGYEKARNGYRWYTVPPTVAIRAVAPEDGP